MKKTQMNEVTIAKLQYKEMGHMVANAVHLHVYYVCKIDMRCVAPERKQV